MEIYRINRPLHKVEDTRALSAQIREKVLKYVEANS